MIRDDQPFVAVDDHAGADALARRARRYGRGVGSLEEPAEKRIVEPRIVSLSRRAVDGVAQIVFRNALHDRRVGGFQRHFLDAISVCLLVAGGLAVQLRVELEPIALGGRFVRVGM